MATSKATTTTGVLTSSSPGDETVTTTPTPAAVTTPPPLVTTSPPPLSPPVSFSMATSTLPWSSSLFPQFGAPFYTAGAPFSSFPPFGVSIPPFPTSSSIISTRNPQSVTNLLPSFHAGDSASILRSTCTVKLNRENYLLWKYMILPIVKGYRLEGFLFGTIPRPSVLSPAEMEQWDSTDQLLMGWLLSSMTEQALSESGYSSPSESGIMRDMGLTIGQYSLFGSFMTFGSILGSTMSGRLSEYVGRKRGMYFLQVFFIAGWLAIAFAQNAWWLYIGRMCIGFSNGIQNYVSVVYVAEITPPIVRGAFTMSTQFMLCCGITLMYFTGNLIPWRTLAFIGTIPCILQVIGVFFIPESPRWLAKVGREKESIASLRRLRGDDADVSEETADIMASTRPSKEHEASGIMQLLDRQYARPLIVGIGVCVLLPLTGGTAILFYASSILEAAGCNVSIGTTVTSLIQLPFSVIGILAMDRVGRRPLLMVDLAGSCLGGFLAGVAFLLQELGVMKSFTPTIVLMSMIISFAFYGMAIGLPFVIMAELFPIKIKGYAGSLASLGYCFSSWIVAYAFNFLFEWSSSGAFFTFAIFAALTIIFVAKLMPETKGLSLEEITALWLDKNLIEQSA